MTHCSTQTAAFTDHGIPDGTELIETTYYILAANNHRSPEPTTEYANHIARAFRQAFIRNAAVPVIPDPIDKTIDDATSVIVHRLLNDTTADLRTEILPVFFKLIADSYCAYLEAGGEPGEADIWFTQDNDGGIPVNQ